MNLDIGGVFKNVSKNLFLGKKPREWCDEFPVGHDSVNYCTISVSFNNVIKRTHI